MVSEIDDPYRELKRAFGRYATGVAVATCVGPDGDIAAITINSFASVSLAPPQVLWCIENKASTFEAFSAAESYAVSVLEDDGQATSERFARPGLAPLEKEEYEVWETGAPVLVNRLAGFDCRVADRLRSGDHVILVGEVLRFDARPGAPLLYFASEYSKGPQAR